MKIIGESPHLWPQISLLKAAHMLFYMSSWLNGCIVTIVLWLHHYDATKHNGLNSYTVPIVFAVPKVATKWSEPWQNPHCLLSPYGSNTMVWTAAKIRLSSQLTLLQHNGLNGWTVPIVFPVTTVATQWFEMLQSSHCLPSHKGCNTMVWNVAE